MAFNAFPLHRYLERVGLDKPPGADEDGLYRIHSAQAFSIPFENIDIHLRRPISLKPEDLTAKILDRKRGGYCFELNGIFRLAMEALGFDVRPCLARVLYGRKDAGARTHEVLITTISGRRWLADTGFGGPGLCLPIPLIFDRIQEQHGERYRLRRDPELGAVLQKEAQNAFLDLYAFNDGEKTLDVDIDMANHFTSTHPRSNFRLHRICSLPHPWGRVTLYDMELAIYRDGQSTRQSLSPGQEYMAALKEHFRIDVDAGYEDLLPLEAPRDSEAADR